ncbi:unnamed protein product [Protopolystoma xenopodis]|uniref:Uncharacterized protein n=1 Tax=Protopolystoma xenopodis TaxID=117903 RepID=A0A448WRZ5_9PLAT|nr:unnamed protein product [Protopolystoma xenopodis]
MVGLYDVNCCDGENSYSSFSGKENHEGCDNVSHYLQNSPGRGSSCDMDQVVGIQEGEKKETAEEGFDSEEVRFLIACQSLRPGGSQLQLVRLVEPGDPQLTRLTRQAFVHADGEVTGLATLASHPLLVVATYSSILH